MANPPRYTVTYNFTPGFSSGSAGPAMTNELDNISTSVNTTIDALADIRRSDGALVNQIVTLDSLAPEVVPLAPSQVLAAIATAQTNATYNATVVLRDGVSGSYDTLNKIVAAVLPLASNAVTLFNGRKGVVTLSASDVSTALTYTPYSAANPSGYQTAAQVAAAIAAGGGGSSGVASFNARTGAVTLSSADVTGALAFTPYSATNPSGYITSSGAPVQSVFGRSGAVVLTSSDVIGALTFTPYNATNPSGYQTAANVTATLTSYAPLASPALTGMPTTPTATLGTNTTQIASTAFVTAAVSAATTGVSAFNTRTGAVTLSSADVTGALTFTPYNATNPAGYQTAANVTATLASYATLASPALTGTPAAPTATAGTNTTQLATTAFVTAGLAMKGAGTVTSVAQTFTGGLISVAGSPITGSGTLALTVAGTSGGIPYFSSASGWASSGVLAANAIVLGGGAGVAPTSLSAGTATTVLHGNASGAPTFGAVSLTADVSGILPVANGGTGVTTSTGSGANVLGTSPTLATPTLGVASATSVNKVAITAPATSATLTLANGSTLATAGAFSVTLTATAATALTLPISGTIATIVSETLGATGNRVWSDGFIEQWDTFNPGNNADAAVTFAVPFTTACYGIQVTPNVIAGTSIYAATVDPSPSATSFVMRRRIFDGISIAAVNIAVGWYAYGK